MRDLDLLWGVCSFVVAGGIVVQLPRMIGTYLRGYRTVGVVVDPGLRQLDFGPSKAEETSYTPYVRYEDVDGRIRYARLVHRIGRRRSRVGTQMRIACYPDDPGKARIDEFGRRGVIWMPLLAVLAIAFGIYLIVG